MVFMKIHDFSGKKGALTFFGKKKKMGQVLFFGGKKTGQGLFLDQKKTGQGLFFDPINSENPARGPHKFCPVPRIRIE